MRWLMTSLLLLLLAVSNGCLSEKLTGFQEIVEANPVGLENCVSTDEGASLIKSLGLYINKLEERIEGDR